MTYLNRLLSCLRPQPSLGDNAASTAGPEAARSTNRAPRPQPVSRPPSPSGTVATTGQIMQAFATRNSVVQAAAEAFDHCVDEWVQASPPDERHNRPRVGYLIREAYQDHATSLDLSSSGMILQKLTSLPDCLSRLISVTELNVSFNKLGALPALPPNLTNLDVRVNELRQLPPLPHTLTTLEAQENNLTQISEIPPGLAHLNLHDNRLTRLPELPPNLSYLGVVNNQLTALPELPGSLTQLAASRNRLADLPPLPPGLVWLAADPETIRASIAHLKERQAALIAAGNPHLAPAVPDDDAPAASAGKMSAPGIDQLGVDLVREITAHFEPGSADAANLASTNRHWRAKLQPRVDMDRDFVMLQRQIDQLKRLTGHDSSVLDRDA